jgi:hypothetical protein
VIEYSDFEVATENWENIRHVEGIGKHLNSLQKGYEADNEPNVELVEAIHDVAKHAGILLHYLVDLQIKLLSVL